MSLPLDSNTVMLFGWIVAAVAMATLWLLQQRARNANIVDVGWTALVGVLAGFAALAGAGWRPRRIVIATLVALWCVRLTTHLVVDRLLRHRAEDGRYQQLRQEWGTRASWRFFLFFQAQALAALFFALPPFLAAADGHTAFRATEVAAIALWAMGFVGESLADHQLAVFKRAPSHRGRTCDVGLWRYSRHPNYFFEWLMWVAYALYVVCSPWGPVAILCPAAMLYLLFNVTGIPATEAQALRTRGDEYRRYQRTTSAFIPWRHA